MQTIILHLLIARHTVIPLALVPSFCLGHHTTSSSNSRFGDHYWMVDVDMDCSQTEDGWFEVKAFLTNSGNGWEGDINQVGEKRQPDRKVTSKR